MLSIVPESPWTNRIKPFSKDIFQDVSIRSTSTIFSIVAFTPKPPRILIVNIGLLDIEIIRGSDQLLSLDPFASLAFTLISYVPSSVQ